MMLGLNICVIIFLLGKPFDEPMMDEYIKQGAVSNIVVLVCVVVGNVCQPGAYSCQYVGQARGYEWNGCEEGAFT